VKLALIAALGLAACATAERQPTRVVPPPAVQSIEAATIDVVGNFRQGGFARGRVPAETKSLTLDGAPVPVTADGGFFIAFGRDAAPLATLAVETAGGMRFSRNLDIAPRAFPEERLPPINRRFDEDPAFAAHRAAELERIRVARAVPGDSNGWREAFIWPVAGRISGVFGSRRVFGDTPESPHSGTDIAADPGTLVVAPAAGTVVLASPPEYSLEGNLVIVDHGLGLYSSFLHLSRVDVAVGQRLAQGGTIGAVGASGRTTGPHLHWGVIWNGLRFDAESLVRATTAATAAK